MQGLATSPYNFINDLEALSFAKYNHGKRSPHCNKTYPFSYVIEKRENPRVPKKIGAFNETDA